jgi:hypothetical protein
VDERDSRHPAFVCSAGGQEVVVRHWWWGEKAACDSRQVTAAAPR